MNRIKERWNETPKWLRIIGMVLLGIAAAALFGFVFGIAVKALWNWLMVDLFSLKAITYWQAVGLVVLARLLFGSFGGGSSEEKKSKRNKSHPHHETSGSDEYDCRGEKWKDWMDYDDWWEEEGKNAFAQFSAAKRQAKHANEPQE